MEDEKGGRGFKVSDRRRFAADGEPRADAADSGAGERREPTPPRPAEPQPQESPEPPRTGDAGPSAPPGQAEMPGVTFEHFLVSLSTQALVLLGEMEDPTSQSPAPDLTGAKQLIDILGMLEEKTKGNLDSAEANLLENMLYQLRMQYVQKMRAS